jgi:hypothetical protein
MENLSKLQPKKFEVTNTLNWSDVYDPDRGVLSEHKLFMMYFNSIPNWIVEEKIDCKKANQWFVEMTRTEIINFHYVKRYLDDKSKTAEYDDLYYLLYDDLMIYFNTRESKVTFLFRKTDATKVDALVQGFKKFPKREKAVRQKPEIHLLVNKSYGLTTTTMVINKPKLSIEDNYNENLLPIHKNHSQTAFDQKR